jgi:hypothetical protein
MLWGMPAPIWFSSSQASLARAARHHLLFGGVHFGPKRWHAERVTTAALESYSTFFTIDACFFEWITVMYFPWKIFLRNDRGPYMEPIGSHAWETDFQFKIDVFHMPLQFQITLAVRMGPCAMEAYCRDEADLIEQTRGTDLQIWYHDYWFM